MKKKEYVEDLSGGLQPIEQIKELNVILKTIIGSIDTYAASQKPRIISRVLVLEALMHALSIVAIKSSTIGEVTELSMLNNALKKIYDSTYKRFVEGDFKAPARIRIISSGDGNKN